LKEEYPRLYANLWNGIKMEKILFWMRKGKCRGIHAYNLAVRSKKSVGKISGNGKVRKEPNILWVMHTVRS